jgi:hypothetical protein
VAMSRVSAGDLQRLDVGCVSQSRRHMVGQVRSAWPTSMPDARIGVCVGGKNCGACRTCVCHARDDPRLSSGLVADQLRDHASARTHTGACNRRILHEARETERRCNEAATPCTTIMRRPRG